MKASQQLCCCFNLPRLHRHPVACVEAHAQTLLVKRCACLHVKHRLAIIIIKPTMLVHQQGSGDHQRFALIQTLPQVRPAQTLFPSSSS